MPIELHTHGMSTNQGLVVVEAMQMGSMPSIPAFRRWRTVPPTCPSITRCTMPGCWAWNTTSPM